MSHQAWIGFGVGAVIGIVIAGVVIAHSLWREARRRR
jgi:hypothetical protein